MRNVFGDSSDSENESAPPPPKKFKPPSVSDVSGDEREKFSSTEQTSSYEVAQNEPPAHFRLSITDDSNSSDEGLDEDSEDAENPRLGLGSRSKSGYNQKASLTESIIDKDSVGYKIMERMGYKPGQTIGSSENRHALVEPLPILAKPARTGIGVVTFKPKAISDISSDSASMLHDTARSKHKERNDRSLLYKLQKYCFAASGEDLELEDGTIGLQDVNHLWRDCAAASKAVRKRTTLFGERASESTITSDIGNHPTEADTTPDTDILEKNLTELIQYARKHFHYCPYCAITYNDDEDLDENCPGATEKDHEIE